MSREIFVLTVLVALSAASAARADAVGPPATSCPDGTHGEASHTGPYCALDRCSTDADCTGGETCQPLSFCIGSMGCGGLQFDAGPFPDGGFYPPCMIATANASCETAACGSGTCSEQSVCAAPPGTPTSHGGCACHVGTRAGNALAWLVALGTLAVLAVRRTKR